MKKILLIGVFIILGGLTSGCIKFVTTVNENGKGTWALAYLIPSDAILSSQDLPSSDPSNALVAMLQGESVLDEPSGIVFAAEERLENGHYWTYIIGEVNSLDSWSEVASAFERVLPDDNSDIVTLTVFAPTVVIDETGDNIRVEFNLLMDDPAAIEAFSESDDYGNLFQYSIEFILPGELVDHNGTIDSLTGNPVWVIRGDNSEDLHFFAESRIE